MLTPDDKSPDGIYDNVGKIIRAESRIWAEMRNRPEPLFELKPSSPAPNGLGLDKNNWRGKVTSICGKLRDQGYPVLSETEIITLTTSTHQKPIASCQVMLRDALQKKLDPGVAGRMFGAIKDMIGKVTGRT